MGFADSRNHARLLVQHGHFAVNGRRTNIPSFQVRPGDVITVREGSRVRTYFKNCARTWKNVRLPPECWM